MKDVLTKLGYSGTKYFPDVILRMVDVGASVSGVTDIGPHIYPMPESNQFLDQNAMEPSLKRLAFLMLSLGIQIQETGLDLLCLDKIF